MRFKLPEWGVEVGWGFKSHTVPVTAVVSSGKTLYPHRLVSRRVNDAWWSD